MDRRNFIAASVVTPLLVACGGGDNIGKTPGAVTPTSSPGNGSQPTPPGSGSEHDPSGGWQPPAPPGGSQSSVPAAAPQTSPAPTTPSTTPSTSPSTTPAIHTLSWNTNGNWFMDNQPFQFFGGEMHPSRVPHQYWDHRIKMIKALGCNAISIYVMWNYHEQPDGSFDFTSPDKNLGNFIDLCQANDMWVIVRSGPYVCGEWDWGGLPPRMLADPQFRNAGGQLQIRGNFPAYLAAVNLFYTALFNDVVKGRALPDGGPIMMVALENEYTSWSPDDPHYINILAEQWLQLGYMGRFCVCDGFAAGFKNNNIILPENTAYAMTADGSSPANYPTAISNYQVATYGAECYPGWICEWSQSGQALHASSFAKGTVAPLAAAGCSFVLYVAHGGTNFGFYAAAEGNSPIAIQPLITSYDYGAPISESGAANQGFVPIQQSFATSATYPVTSYATPAPIPSIADGDIPAIAASSFSFADFLAGISPGIQSNLPQTVEWIARQMNASNPANGVYPSGVAVYETTLSASASSITVTFDRPPDYALAFINGVLVPGTVLNTVSNGPFKPVTSFTSSNVPANALLQIVCMPFGRVCFGATGILNEGKGLSQNVYVNGSPVLNWTMMLDPLSAGQLDALVFGAGVPANGHPFFATAPLVVSNPRDMYIDMSNWGTGYVFINGINLGRYWAAAGPQKRLYCPGVWLTQGTNSIVVFEFTQRTAGSLSFYGESGLPYLVS